MIDVDLMWIRTSAGREALRHHSALHKSIEASDPYFSGVLGWFDVLRPTSSR